MCNYICIPISESHSTHHTPRTESHQRFIYTTFVVRLINSACRTHIHHDDGISQDQYDSYAILEEWCFTYWCLVGNWWEWGNGMVVDSYCGSVPHSLLRTSKFMISHDFPATYGDPFWRWRILWSPMVKSPSASLTGTTWTSEWFSSPASSTQKSKKKSPKGIPSGNLT